MGILLRWEKPETETAWVQTKIYRSNSSGGTYINIATVTLPTTYYFDEQGNNTKYYKITFYNTSTLVESPLSDEMQGDTYGFYVNPTQIRQWLQFSSTDVPTDDDLMMFIEQANTQLELDTNSVVTSFLKLVGLHLTSSYVFRALAGRALRKGYIEMTVDGATVRKAYNELTQIAELFEKKYDELVNRLQTEVVITSFMSVVDSEVQQDYIDMLHGTSDAFDYQNANYPSEQDRRDGGD